MGNPEFFESYGMFLEKVGAPVRGPVIFNGQVISYDKDASALFPPPAVLHVFRSKPGHLGIDYIGRDVYFSGNRNIDEAFREQLRSKKVEDYPISLDKMFARNENVLRLSGAPIFGPVEVDGEIIYTKEAVSEYGDVWDHLNAIHQFVTDKDFDFHYIGSYPRRRGDKFYIDMRNKVGEIVIHRDVANITDKNRMSITREIRSVGRQNFEFASDEYITSVDKFASDEPRQPATLYNKLEEKPVAERVVAVYHNYGTKVELVERIFDEKIADQYFKAVQKFYDVLREESDIRQTLTDGIAVSFQQAYDSWKANNPGEQVTPPDIWQMSNRAANNFINELIKKP